MSNAAPPGWYPDPQDPSRQRYFDGAAWTDQVSARQETVLSRPPRHSWVTWAIVSAIVAVLLLFGGCAAAVVTWTAVRESTTDLAVESAVGAVNSGIGLPDGNYLIPQALAATADQESVTCVFAGAAVPAQDPLSPESTQVTLAAGQILCQDISPESMASMEVFTVQFTVRDGVASVTKVTSAAG